MHLCDSLWPLDKLPNAPIPPESQQVIRRFCKYLKYPALCTKAWLGQIKTYAKFEKKKTQESELLIILWRNNLCITVSYMLKWE